MRNDMKTWIHIDSKGNSVPGMTIRRKNKPKVGRWVEVVTNICCDPFIAVTATPGNVSGTTWDVEVACTGGQIALVLPFTATDINSLTSELNASAGWLGEFSTNGTTITLKLNGAIATDVCGDNSLTLTIALD